MCAEVSLIAASSTIDIDGVGPVVFERSKRAKHVNISVKPFTGVRVAVPQGSSFARAEEFVYAKTDWIRKHLNKMKQVEQEHDTISESSVDIDRAKARRKLTTRLKQLAEEHRFAYNRIFIRNQRTRWGSCSPQDNISLNVKLVTLPDELMNYVILHELVHTRAKNHGRDFWTHLQGLVGNAENMESKLKEYGFRLL
jgi:predicted metal-dependent hydrolase